MKKAICFWIVFALVFGLVSIFPSEIAVSADAATVLSPHFAWEEFFCECGARTEISGVLIDRLEELFDLFQCSKIIITSGYRCLECDDTPDYHTYGKAADAIFYDSNGAIIDARIICCVASDIGIPGISNVNSGYRAVHLDVRETGTYRGDEIYGTRSIWNQPGADGQVHWNFYEYWGLTWEDVYKYVYQSSPPEQPVVSVTVGDSQHNTVIAWTACANATHYDIRFYNNVNELIYAVGLDEGTQTSDGNMLYAETSLSYVFAAGSYHVNVTALNSQTGESSISEDVYFTVAAYTPPGDLDGDGELTAADADMLLRQLKGVEAISSESDLNADGIVNGKDLTLLKRAVMQAAA